MKLQTKLLAGFLFSTLITLAVGLFAHNKLHDLDDADTVLYERAQYPWSI